MKHAFFRFSLIALLSFATSKSIVGCDKQDTKKAGDNVQNAVENDRQSRLTSGSRIKHGRTTF